LGSRCSPSIAIGRKVTLSRSMDENAWRKGEEVLRTGFCKPNGLGHDRPLAESTRPPIARSRKNVKLARVNCAQTAVITLGGAAFLHRHCRAKLMELLPPRGGCRGHRCSLSGFPHFPKCLSSGRRRDSATLGRRSPATDLRAVTTDTN
jgi:hypothetical protein